MGGLSLYNDGKIAAMTHSSSSELISHELRPRVGGAPAGGIWDEVMRARGQHPQALAVLALPEEMFQAIDALPPDAENVFRAALLLGFELMEGGALKDINEMAFAFMPNDKGSAMRGWEG